MRDIGTLFWIVIVVVGVISSIASSVRRQGRSAAVPVPAAAKPPLRRLPPRPPPVQAPADAQRAQPVSSRTRTMPQTRQVRDPFPIAPPAFAELKSHAPGRARLFGDRPALVRAIVAAEVLGKPRSLSDEY